MIMKPRRAPDTRSPRYARQPDSRGNATQGNEFVMHESGLIHNLVHRLEAAARDADATGVTGATVWLGALSQMSPEHFREHFAAEVRGTLAEGARLTLESSDDPESPDAQSVILRSVELRV